MVTEDWALAALAKLARTARASNDFFTGTSFIYIFFGNF
jgi:hypothetical protein